MLKENDEIEKYDRTNFNNKDYTENIDDITELNQNENDNLSLEFSKDKSEMSKITTMNQIDLILETRGYNYHTYKIILLTFLILSIEGMHLTLFSFIIIPLTNYFSITSFENKFLSSILFVGVALGSFLSGSFNIKYGRPLKINIFTFVIFICNFSMAYSTNLFLFAFLRFLVGISIGIIVPMSLNILAEYLPVKYRSIVLTGVWVGFGAGSLIFLTIMLIIMPNLETTGVSTTFLISSFLPLFTLILNFLFLTDSPRNLIIRNKDEEAFLILEKINCDKIQPEIKILIVTEIMGGVNKELKSLLYEIFSRKYLKLTMLLIFIWFFNSIITYGPSVISSLTMKSLGQGNNESIDSTTNNKNTEIIYGQIVVTLIGLPSSLLGGILSEIPSLGRNKTTLLNLSLSLVFLFVLVIFPNIFEISFGFYMSFVGIAFNLNTTYSCEVYPTKIRDQAIGFLFFCTRFGGFLSQIIFLLFQGWGVFYPYYAAMLFVSINLILVFLLPFETHGQPLDNDYSTHQKE